MSPIRIFADSSVIIAGMASARGGSREILKLAEAGALSITVSEYVIGEVFRNLERKLPVALPEFAALIKAVPFKLVSPGPDSLLKASSLINSKDAPILAAAFELRCAWLISLDRHFLELDPAPFPFSIGTPGDFLGRWQGD